MPTGHRISLRRRVGGCVLILLLIPFVYYLVQVMLRTPSLTPMQAIAHRGGLAYKPENTLSAFQNAIDQGVDWLEFDVQMTKDGALVVIHDETVDRTTNGTGAVRDLTLEQIRSLDAGGGQKVPTFDEVLQLAKTAGVNILPETKSAHLYPGMEVKLMQALEQADYLDHTIIQSFEAPSLELLRRLNPDARLCALSGLWRLSLTSPPGDAGYLCPMAEMVLLNPAMVRQAHQEGRQVFVYFGFLENGFGRATMRFFGVDGMIVNDPLPLLVK